MQLKKQSAEKTNCPLSQTHIDVTRVTHEIMNVKIEFAASLEATRNVIHAIEDTRFSTPGVISTAFFRGHENI